MNMCFVESNNAKCRLMWTPDKNIMCVGMIYEKLWWQKYEHRCCRQPKKSRSNVSLQICRFALYISSRCWMPTASKGGLAHLNFDMTSADSLSSGMNIRMMPCSIMPSVQRICVLPAPVCWITASDREAQDKEDDILHWAVQETCTRHPKPRRRRQRCTISVDHHRTPSSQRFALCRPEINCQIHRLGDGSVTILGR